jgi:hypothetical protein
MNRPVEVISAIPASNILNPTGFSHLSEVVALGRDCHGYTRGNPWAFKRAQEEPKRIRNEGAMVKTVFGPYLLHYLSVWALLGLV